LNEVCRINVQNIGYPQNVPQSKIAFTTLDRTEVCPVQAGGFGDAFLRTAERNTLSPNSGAEDGEGIRVASWDHEEV
jgi:hypothetical protein